MLNHDNVMFNALKHHARSIRQFISSSDRETLLDGIKNIGNCQLDLYYGSLSVESIYDDALWYLSSVGVSSFESYSDFLKSNNGYFIIELSDHSRWVLLMGRSEKLFVHLHPARNSRYTLRITASALKTAIGLILLMKKGVISECELKSINKMRKDFLGLPPVKKLEDMKAVERVTRILLEFPQAIQEENQLVST